MSIDLNRMPKLGFGLMRLPEQDGKIDLEEVCRMVDAYLAAGLNYFDTAYVYHGGNSEKIVKEALAKRHPRDSFMVATKLPAWCMKAQADRDRIFNEQLSRCGLDYFDFYLLHSVEDGSNGDTYDRLDCWSWALEKKAEGKIRHFLTGRTPSCARASCMRSCAAGASPWSSWSPSKAERWRSCTPTWKRSSGPSTPTAPSPPGRCDSWDRCPG